MFWRTIPTNQRKIMVNTRKIAEDIMAYSKAHENDALEATESYGDIKWVNWETPYYCYTIEELEDNIIADCYLTTAEAIEEMTKTFKMQHEFAEDIRGYGDSPMRPGTDEWDEFIDYEINRVNS